MPSKLNTPDVFWLSIGELHAKLVAKEFSCQELTKAWLDRLETIGPRYNALALSLRKPAISRAKDIDKELKRGRTRGLLQGGSLRCQGPVQLWQVSYFLGGEAIRGSGF